MSLPKYQTAKSAACDLTAYESSILSPGAISIIGTGLTTKLLGGLLEGQCALILPRSGLAAKYGVTVLNSPGLIDADYEGEIKVILVNHSKSDFVVNVGDRIAQLMCITYSDFLNVTRNSTTRGDGGFGSTGV